MDPRSKLLGLLSAQKIGENYLRMAAKIGKPLGVFDAVTEIQPSYYQAAYGRNDINPKNRFAYRSPDYDESYDMIADVAQRRQQTLARIAEIIRKNGGTAKDVQAAWRDPYTIQELRKSGMKNPADLLRGAGRYTPKQGDIEPPMLKEYNNAFMQVDPRNMPPTRR